MTASLIVVGVGIVVVMASVVLGGVVALGVGSKHSGSSSLTKEKCKLATSGSTEKDMYTFKQGTEEIHKCHFMDSLRAVQWTPSNPATLGPT